MDQVQALEQQPARSDELLEASWPGRVRAIRGRELRLELALTAGFLAAVAILLAVAPPVGAPHPICAAVVVAYGLAARTDFPVGAGHAVPTLLFLVPLFGLAPAQLVPLMVFGGLALGAAADAALGRARFDRVLYSAGDAVHSVGPAIVLLALAGGDGTSATAAVVALALAAQLACDFASSSLHDLVVFGVRPKLHLRVLLQVWGVDAALAPIGLLAAAAAEHEPAAALAPLPLVALLGALSADRSRRIAAAHDRLRALQRERRRLQDAVERTGDAFASSLDLEALLGVVTAAATEALEGEAGRSATIGRPGGKPVQPVLAGAAERHSTALERAAQRALSSPGAPVTVELHGVHAVACLIGAASEPVAVVAVARGREFSSEECDLLTHLCQQATVSAANARNHELLLAAEARLRHQAFHDILTGLPNRALFTDRVAHALRRHARDGRRVAVLFVDLDAFKLVNDRLGHDAGDELLVALARRIGSCLRQADTAARFGGDEFAVLLEDVGDGTQAEAVAERLRVALAVPVHMRGREFNVRASVGLALADAESTHEKLLRRANLAMYAAKRDGGDRVQRFHPEMLTTADSRTELAYDLRSAAAQRELELHFQPIVDLVDGGVWGVEALVRWRHPEQGLLTAGDFIGLAEEVGAMEEIERFSLDEACRVAATWPEIGGRAPNLSVNVSAGRLRGQDFVAEVEETARRHGLAPERLVLEVTESVALDSDARTEANLSALRGLGVRLALDDFGTGYSSLSYVARFPVDLFKLDRTFLAGMAENGGEGQLVGGVIQLAASVGVPVVVEGVERADEIADLMSLGARLGQGFFLGRPMDAEALAQRLRVAADGPRPGVLGVVGRVA